MIKNDFRIIFVIIGTIIGAGFASGQEIYSFFGIYGYKGICGIIISTLLMCFIIYKVLIIIKNDNINTYQEFLGKILNRKNIFIRNYILNIVNMFLLISFYIMITGFTMYFVQELNINKIYGAILISSLLIITFSKNVNGIIKINNFLMPILIILFVILGIKTINKVEMINESVKYKWILSAILYASYNSIILIPILIDLKEYILNEKRITFITGTIIMTLSLIIYFILLSNVDKIRSVEIPIVYIAGNLGNKFRIIYGIVILIAIYTSAVSAGYGFLMNMNKKKYKLISWVICISGIFICNIGFSNLINLMYPVFGVLGIIQIFFLIKT